MYFLKRCFVYCLVKTVRPLREISDIDYCSFSDVSSTVRNDTPAVLIANFFTVMEAALDLVCFSFFFLVVL